MRWKTFDFDKKYLNNYAGFEITENLKYKNAIKSLEILNFQFKENKVLIPNTRHDIKNMQNIVEEVFRFYGLNNFKPKQIALKPTIYSEIETIEKNISALGYTQAWTYTLIIKEKNEFNPFNFNETKNLKTFVSEEYNSIRNSIAIPLLNVFEYNKKRKMENASFFDTGMINDRNAIIIASNQKTYSQIKNDIEKIAKQKFEIKKLDNSFLHPNYNAGLFLGQIMVGWIGKFNPFKYDSDVIFAEILKDCIYKGHNRFLEFDSNPLKERDITLEIEKDYENEITLFQFNRSIDSSIDTFILFPSTDNLFLSSSSIKELVMFNSDISKYVPEGLSEYITNKLKGGNLNGNEKRDVWNVWFS